MSSDAATTIAVWRVNPLTNLMAVTVPQVRPEGEVVRMRCANCRFSKVS